MKEILLAIIFVISWNGIGLLLWKFAKEYEQRNNPTEYESPLPPITGNAPIIMNCELYDNGKGGLCIPSDSRALYMNCIIHCNGESQTKEGE